MEYLLILLLGLVIGSFLNVCIFRIPREESIAFPGSHCMKCGYELKWYDLVPVVSYIILHGKCRKCGDKISLQYPIIEIANGLMYIALYYKYGLSLDCIKYMILCSLMIVIGVIDFKTKYVYIQTTIFGVTAGIIFIICDWVINKSLPLDNILGGLLGFVFIWLIVVITRGMGEGDIEISLVGGLFLGLKGTIFMLFSAIILGGIVSGIILLLKLKDRKAEIAFGPYLGIGAIISVFFGTQIINLYLTKFIV